MAQVQATGKLQRDNVSGAQTFTNAFPANATAGNTCFVDISHYSSIAGSNITGVTIGGTAATLIVRKPSADNANFAETWRATNVAGGTRDVVVTLTGGAGQYLTCGGDEWDNVQSTPDDGNGTGGPTTSSAPSATTSSSTTVTPTLLRGVFTDYAGTSWTSATPPSAWTEAWEETDGTSHEAGSAAYYVDSGATGTKTGTFATGSSMSWVCAISAYKLSSSAKSMPVVQTLLNRLPALRRF